MPKYMQPYRELFCAEFTHAVYDLAAWTSKSTPGDAK